MKQFSQSRLAAEQIELLIHRCNSLPIFAQTAADCLELLNSTPVEYEKLSSVIKSDAGLTAQLFRNTKKAGNDNDQTPRPADLIKKKQTSGILESLLSSDIFTSIVQNNNITEKITQLARFNNACALGSELIARAIDTAIDEQTAYTTGLLSDVGLLMLFAEMPKSINRKIEQAQTQGQSLLQAEQENLGIDHSIIGRRLAEKWKYPIEFTEAIGNCHYHPNILKINQSSSKLPVIVYLARQLAASSGIDAGLHISNSEQTENIYAVAADLDLAAKRIDDIIEKIQSNSARQAERININAEISNRKLNTSLLRTLSKLSQSHSTLAERNRQLFAKAGQFDFINGFLENVDCASEPLALAAELTVRWKHHFQTGPVCVYLLDRQSDDFVQSVFCSANSQPDYQLLRPPADTILNAVEFHKTAGLYDASQIVPWIFEQLRTEMAAVQCKFVPLISDDTALGAIIFQVPGGIEASDNAEMFVAAAEAVSNLIYNARKAREHKAAFEQFKSVLNIDQDCEKKKIDDKIFSAICDISAGAAHELNNPLAVIQGRADILGKSETDDEKIKTADQIKTKAGELAGIVNDLMAFAEPAEPKPQAVSISKIIDSAVEKISQNPKFNTADIARQIPNSIGDVCVDAEQTSKAIAALVANAIESYPNNSGPIQISAAASNSNSVQLQIKDNGCGMDARTTANAMIPFFSSKTAGRQRGMGLSHAKRLLYLNKCSLNIASVPKKGTTITVKLPTL